MNIFNDFHTAVIEKLINHEVEFMLVGGVAVNFYGYDRMTGDLDLWIDGDAKNKVKLLDAFEAMDFDESGINFLRNSDFDVPFVFSIGEEPEKIDFLTQVGHLVFSECYSDRKNHTWEKLVIPFISLKDLIITKMLTGRLQDRADVEELQKIHGIQ